MLASLASKSESDRRRKGVGRSSMLLPSAIMVLARVLLSSEESADKNSQSQKIFLSRLVARLATLLPTALMMLFVSQTITLCIKPPDKTGSFKI